MRIKTLIKKLQAIEEKHGNIDVVIGFDIGDDDESLYYDCEVVKFLRHYDDYKGKFKNYVNIAWIN